jgi:protein gp37
MTLNNKQRLLLTNSVNRLLTPVTFPLETRICPATSRCNAAGYVVNMIAVFWDMTSFIAVEVHESFRWIWRPHHSCRWVSNEPHSGTLRLTVLVFVNFWNSWAGTSIVVRIILIRRLDVLRENRACLSFVTSQPLQVYLFINMKFFFCMYIYIYVLQVCEAIHP